MTHPLFILLRPNTSRLAARMNVEENPSIAQSEGGLASEEFRYRAAYSAVLH